VTGQPLVSLVLVVKNGMPYLPEALDSIAAQTYDNYEVVVQDGASTDGTLDVLRAADELPLEIESAVDGGVGDAYNRAIRRCSGEIVGSIDADNLLLPDAIDRAVAFLTSRPDVVAAYGGSNMIEADGRLRYPWMPAEFDLLTLLTCELVPPFAVSFFSRDRCGDELRFDEALKTCADFDLWLRISHLPIARIDAVLGSTRLSPVSMTRRPETYEQYIVDKTAALERYFATVPPLPLIESLRKHADAGLHIWAADSVYDIEGTWTDQVERYVEHAERLVPRSPRVELLRSRAQADAARAEPTALLPESAMPMRRLFARARRKSSARF
jgi:glycosyltransferase involved in cell wall biosynthesis